MCCSLISGVQAASARGKPDTIAERGKLSTRILAIGLADQVPPIRALVVRADALVSPVFRPSSSP